MEDLSSRRGLVSTLKISCTNALCKREGKILDPMSSEGKNLNTRSVMGMRSIGRGRTSLETFCGMMDMLPPLGSTPYSRYNQSLSEMSLEVAESNMRDASAYLRRQHGVEPGELHMHLSLYTTLFSCGYVNDCEQNS